MAFIVTLVIVAAIWWRWSQNPDTRLLPFLVWTGMSPSGRWVAVASTAILVLAVRQPLPVILFSPFTYLGLGWAVTVVTTTPRLAAHVTSRSVEVWNDSRDLRRRWLEQAGRAVSAGAHRLRVAVGVFLSEWFDYHVRWGDWSNDDHRTRPGPGSRSTGSRSAGGTRAGAGRQRHQPPPPPDDPVATAYTVLGVRPDTPPEEIRRRYMDLVKRLHPDRHPHLDAEARQRLEDRLKVVNAAFDTITAHQRA